MNELDRIKNAYERRARQGLKTWSLFEPGHLFIHLQRQRALVQLLRQAGLQNLNSLSICEVGCGNGDVLREFVLLGAEPENLHGVDLLEDRIEDAQRLSPNIDFRCGNAQHLPFENDSFDLVLSFTVFTSILDAGLREAVAKEILRILKPDGAVIWYDYFVENPNNPDVQKVPPKEIRRLFPGCDISLQKTTLAPPLARWAAKLSWELAVMLETIPLLRTHLLGTIRKT